MASKDLLARQSALEAALVDHTDTPQHVLILFQQLVNGIRSGLGSRPVDESAITVHSKKLASECETQEGSAAYIANVEVARPV